MNWKEQRQVSILFLKDFFFSKINFVTLTFIIKDDHTLISICGASSRYPYKVGDHMNSRRSTKNIREAEFQAFHHFFGGGGGKVIGKLYIFEA